MRVFLTSVLLLIGYSSQVSYAQSPGTWEVYPSLRTINAAVKVDNTVWAATQGGILISDGESTDRITSLDGLSRPDIQSITYDPDTQQIFTGYVDGVIDVIDRQNFSVRTLRDIERASNFTAKGINSLRAYQGKIYAATDFGIVVIDARDLFVIESFLQIGEIARGVAVASMYIDNDTLYAGTAEGIGVGDLSRDLSLNSNWNYYNTSNGFEDRRVNSVIAYNNSIYASTADLNYRFDGSSWTQTNEFGSSAVIDLTLSDDRLLALKNDSLYILTDASASAIDLDGKRGTTLIRGQNSSLVELGTLNNGLVRYNPADQSFQSIIPAGPYLNLFAGLSFSGDILLSGTTQRSSLDFRTDQSRGYYIRRDGEWFNFNQLTTPILRQTNFRQVFRTAETAGYYYFGSWGQGIARHDKETDEIYVFNETNSTLRGWPADSETFPVMSGLSAENEEEIWAVSRFGGTPLYYQREGDEDWLAFDKDDAVNSSDEYFSLFIDSFGNKWITLQNTSNAGTGLLVLDTGDPEDPNDDRGQKLTTSNDDGNLPDGQVKAIIQDRNDEVWIGTQRGIARFIFPDLIVDGGPNERRAQWLINADTSAASRFLLRDINVSAMAVNAANEKWIGSVNQGIYVLNEDGSRIIERFTEENSSLLSDNIQSIAINEQSGEVFIATDRGLQSYRGVSLQAKQEMRSLKVFPNPFQYAKNDQIFIEGLSENTIIRIMSVDGQVFNEIEARGGRTAWDGRDYNGSNLPSGVYFVVALSENGEQKGIGKVVIVQ